MIRFKKTPGSENFADFFSNSVTRHICEKHIEGLGCTFDAGREQCAAQPHAMNIKREVVERCENLMKDGLKSHEVSEDDWSGAHHMDIDQLIGHAKPLCDKRYCEIQDHWSRKLPPTWSAL